MVSTSVNAFATRFGMSPRELKRFIKFACVGVIGAVVDFGSFNLLLGPVSRYFESHEGIVSGLAAILSGWNGLTAFSLATALVGTVSFFLAIISNFIWNRYWTYPDSRSKSLRRQFAQFFIVNASGILLRFPIVIFTTQLFVNLVGSVGALSNYAERLGANLAVAFAVGIVMFWNFFANRYWTYNDVE